ncbi:hypothetical protein A3Q56_04668 [Intoshia linei]|uniref:Uncharacterized protein n=1 Tax=Intoshia linei TaxID=1819745 RepID=A0A177B2G9_9BILA|nr:hypothetical protein A3Q56_04668 [Intoshia linei]
MWPSSSENEIHNSKEVKPNLWNESDRRGASALFNVSYSIVKRNRLKSRLSLANNINLNIDAIKECVVYYDGKSFRTGYERIAVVSKKSICPENLTGNVDDGTFYFEDNYMNMRITKGASYKHMLWQHYMEIVTARDGSIRSKSMRSDAKVSVSSSCRWRLKLVASANGVSINTAYDWIRK